MVRGEELRKNNKEASRGWEDDPEECSRARGWVKEMDACLVEKHLQERESHEGGRKEGRKEGREDDC